MGIYSGGVGDSSGCRWYLGGGLQAHMARIRGRLQASAAAGEAVSAMEDFPCERQCNQCGRLAQREPRCLECGNDNWLDLRNHEYARSLQDEQQIARQTPPAWVGKIAWPIAWLGYFAMLAIVYWLFSLFQGSMAWIAVFFVILGILFGITLALGQWLHKPLARKLLPTMTESPLYWQAPAPRPQLDAELAEEHNGELHTDGEPILAPFTQTPCIGYRAGVFLYDDNAIQPFHWLLDISVATDLLIHMDETQVAIPGAEATMALQLQPIAEDALAIEPEELRRWLRERGIFWGEEELLFFEAQLHTLDTITARRYTEPKGSGFVVQRAQ